ncbi:SMP-30/gluconolactonase/LRE family protein [Skermanella mucosa]|uniref:SMP-30/gluconolactonase/LRE family protein n=1 Tax=Skermanella mucosa TaxID=1789672 RepID=UPI00192C9976|nr:SMP-30/gluconolactonase/LRE family protein [Skermanella mucosa]UEM22507.1 SMP-30/gluconolactonase/LRE family protein [Skermanella mucosa]
MDRAFEIIDERFKRYALGNVFVERLHTGMRWAEGPVWFGDAGQLLWSDIPNNRIMRWVEGGGVSVFRSPSNFSNGNTRDRQGRLVTCEHGARRVTRTEHDGTVTVLADSYQGRRLNSPNDVVVKSDGSVWFTDPPYGILTDYEGHRSEMEQDGCHVYRIDPETGQVTVAADDFDKPNGIAFSPDEHILYVADTGASHRKDGPHHIRAFTVSQSGTLSGGEVFATIQPGLADGFRLDTDGNVWTSAGDGVHCYSPNGDLIGKVLVPEVVSNLAFGGPKRNRLFITATTSLYSVYVGANGAGPF